MRATAGFHADQAALEASEERQHLGSPQPPPQDRRARGVRPMHLKDILRHVEPDRRNLHPDGPP
jgi:hypothetical protein